MRVLAFISYLCFLLLGSGEASYAAADNNAISYISKQYFTQDDGITFSDKDQNNTIIEDNDTEADDYQDAHLQKDKKNNIVFGNGYFYDNSFSRVSSQLALNYYFKSSPTVQPADNYSLPIYLKNRVLRI